MDIEVNNLKKKKQNEIPAETCTWKKIQGSCMHLLAESQASHDAFLTMDSECLLEN